MKELRTWITFLQTIKITFKPSGYRLDYLDPTSMTRESFEKAFGGAVLFSDHEFLQKAAKDDLVRLRLSLKKKY